MERRYAGGSQGAPLYLASEQTPGHLVTASNATLRTLYLNSQHLGAEASMRRAFTSLHNVA